MNPLRWTTDDLVYVPEVDEEHQRIFEDAESLRRSLASGEPAAGTSLWSLFQSLSRHLANEERLMHTSRFSGFAWHQRQHDAGRKKMALLMQSVQRNDMLGVREDFEDLVRWLADHLHVADRMLASHLRNDRRERIAS